MSEFQPKRVSRERVLTINAPAVKVFPLLCPQRETEWLDGWNYKMIFSTSGLAENDAIFSTKHDGDVNTIWAVSRYDKRNKLIEFVRLTWETVITKIIYKVKDNHDGSSSVFVQYIFTSLTEKGDEYVNDSGEKHFEHMTRWIEKSLNYFLQSGRKLLMLNSRKPKQKEVAPVKKVRRKIKKG